MTTIIAIAAFVIGLYAGCVILDTANRQPLTPTHGQRLERRQAVYTIVLVVAMLVLGLSLDKLLP